MPFNTQSEGSCQKARRYSSIGVSKLGQAAKTTWTLNGTNSQLRDSTASILPLGSVLRKRSFHSNGVSLNTLTKGNRDDTSVSEATDNHSKKLVGATKPIVKKAVKPSNVTTMVMERLNYNNGNKYYKLLDILKGQKPSFCSLNDWHKFVMLRVICWKCWLCQNLLNMQIK